MAAVVAVEARAEAERAEARVEMMMVVAGLAEGWERVVVARGVMTESWWRRG